MLLICSFAISANAQFYNEMLLFIEVGKTIENSSSIVYIHFDENGHMYHTNMNKNEARNKYKKGILKEHGVNQKHYYTRDYSISTTKYRGVYSKDRYVNTGWGIIGYYGNIPQWGNTSAKSGKNYYGISRDQMVFWYTTNESNEAKSKKFYKAIKPEDLIPKEVEHDFL